MPDWELEEVNRHPSNTGTKDAEGYGVFVGWGNAGFPEPISKRIVCSTYGQPVHCFLLFYEFPTLEPIRGKSQFAAEAFPADRYRWLNKWGPSTKELNPGLTIGHQAVKNPYGDDKKADDLFKEKILEAWLQFRNDEIRWAHLVVPWRSRAGNSNSFAGTLLRRAGANFEGPTKAHGWSNDLRW